MPEAREPGARSSAGRRRYDRDPGRPVRRIQILCAEQKAVFLYNFVDLQRVRWEGADPLTPGKHTLEFDFKYDGLGAGTLAFNSVSGIGRGGTGVLKVDGKEVTRRTIEHTIPLIMQWDENFDIGADTGTLVAEDYQVSFKFTGKLNKLPRPPLRGRKIKPRPTSLETLKIDRPP